jgi:hypothetical protein
LKNRVLAPQVSKEQRDAEIMQIGINTLKPEKKA